MLVILWFDIVIVEQGTDSEGTDEDDGPEILDAYVKAKSLRSTGESKHM